MVMLGRDLPNAFRGQIPRIGPGKHFLGAMSSVARAFTAIYGQDAYLFLSKV